VVPLPEADDRLNNLDRLLRRINGQLSEDQNLNESIEQAKVASDSLSARAEQATLSLRSPTIEELRAMETDWRPQTRTIERQREPVTQRLVELEQHISQLQAERKLWQQARAQYLQAVGADVLVKRVDDLLARIGQTLDLAQKHRQDGLVVQNLLARQQLLASEVLGNIRDTEKKYGDSLLQADNRPIWQLFAGQAGSRYAERTHSSMSAWFSQTWDLLKERWLSLLWMALILLAVSRVAVKLARKSAARQAGRIGHGDTSLFDQHPDRVAVILAVCLLFWLPEAAPVFLGRFVQTVLTVFFFLLIPPLFPAAFRPLLNLITGVYLMSRFWSFFASAPLLERLTSIFVLATVVVTTARLMRPSRLKKFPGATLVPGFVIRAIWLALLLLVSALTANLLGYSALSRLLSGGVLRSVFSAIRLYVLARLAGGLFSLLLRSRWAQSLASIRLHGSALYLWASRAFVSILVVWWILATLDNFAVADRVLDWLSSVFVRKISIGAVGFTLWDVVLFGLVLLGTYAFSRTVEFFLQEDVLPRLSWRRGLPNAILTLIHYSLMTAGFLIAIAAVGMDLTRFTVLAGAFGVGIGFGLQNVISNFVSGLILLFERPVNLNDVVEIGGLTGQVKHIGIRAITIHTGQGADVIVPNSSLVSNQFINWTYLDTVRRFDLKVMVARGTEPERVLKLLTDVSRSILGVEKEPPPAALFLGFGENALNFELRYWLQVGTPPEVESTVALAVASELRKAGIEVPIPQRDLYLKSVSADIWRQPAQETKHSSAENSGQKPSALDLLPQASPRRAPEADPLHSPLRKRKE
jgi:small-conductance mechanosensitive channel